MRGEQIDMRETRVQSGYRVEQERMREDRSGPGTQQCVSTYWMDSCMQILLESLS